MKKSCPPGAHTPVEKAATLNYIEDADKREVTGWTSASWGPETQGAELRRTLCLVSFPCWDRTPDMHGLKEERFDLVTVSEVSAHG